MFRKDRNCFGGGLYFSINESIACRTLANESQLSNSEIITLELNLRRRKWLLFGLYKPPSQNEDVFLNSLSNALEKYLQKYENIILIGDFNMTPKNKNLQKFLNSFNLECLITEPTCFKGDPSCIDLILTNRKNYHKKSTTFVSGISDFHKIVATSLKSTFIKGNPKTILYRDYKHFEAADFDNDLREALSNQQLNYADFHLTFLQILDRHALVKKKVVRANNNNFMTKALRKAIMQRSHLKKLFLKSRNAETWNSYKKQRNFCTNLLRKTKKEYFNSLDVCQLNDNKKFWKNIRPFFSDKGLNSNKLMLIENEVLVNKEDELANIMNSYYINVTKKLDLKKAKPNLNSIEEIIDNYKNHISYVKIQENFSKIF